MSLFNKISAQERAHFANNLSVMLKSGVSINDCLVTLATQADSKRFGKAIGDVAVAIEQGEILSAAFAKHEQVFSPIFVNLIKAGEQSGTLQENLTFLATWFERSSDLKRDVDGATLYPKLVLSAALLLGGSLSIFILPRLIPLFGQLDVELPLITKVLLSVSVFVQTQWFLSLIVIAVLFTVIKFITKIFVVRKFLHTAYLKLPVMGPILVEYQLALIMQLLATLLRSGLPISEAIDIAHDVAPNIRFKESIHTMGEKVRVGVGISKAMTEYKNLYPPLCQNIVSVGEQSGTLADSFEYLADHYTREVKAKAKRLPTIIEPLLLIFIAMIVGLVALAIVLPIYKLTGSINR